MKKTISLEELEERAKKQKEDQRERVRLFMHQSYHYAKSLGFSASEAQVLQKHSKETIKSLAEERRHQNGGG